MHENDRQRQNRRNKSCTAHAGNILVSSFLPPSTPQSATAGAVDSLTDKSVSDKISQLSLPVSAAPSTTENSLAVESTSDSATSNQENSLTRKIDTDDSAVEKEHPHEVYTAQANISIWTCLLYQSISANTRLCKLTLPWLGHGWAIARCAVRRKFQAIFVVCESRVDRHTPSKLSTHPFASWCSNPNPDIVFLVNFTNALNELFHNWSFV